MTLEIKEVIEAMSLPASGTLRQAMWAIDQGALGLALLIEPDTKRFVGLVTDGDIRRALLNGHGLESPVATVSRPEPKIARVGMSLEQVAALFSDPVRVVPLFNDDGQVVDLAVFDRRMRLPVAEPSLGERELLYVSECVLTGWVSSVGKFVTRFEEMFADFCDTRYAVATSNGTAALHLGLLALDIGPGDEVIVPTLTFIATANAVTYSGARPVFVDSESETWNIDPKLIEEAVTPRTKAIIPVHLYGHPVDMDPVLAIAEKYNLRVIEDAAEAHGAEYKSRKVGSFGDAGCFSFFGNKIITTGEGGMIVTDNTEIAEKARMLRDHGMSKEMKYWHPHIGFNYRLTNIQAAIGVAQLERINSLIDRKRKNACLYNALLKDTKGITLPAEKSWAKNVYWMYSVLLEDECGMTRDALMKKLSQNGVETRPLFYPMHTMPPYENDESFPVAEELSRKGISLPSAVSLKEEEIMRVVENIVSLKEDRLKGND